MNAIEHETKAFEREMNMQNMKSNGGTTNLLNGVNGLA